MLPLSYQDFEHKLREVIPKLRKPQAEALLKAFEAVQKGRKYILLNAPTGFGKTLVALVFAIYCFTKYRYVPIIFVRTRNELSTYVRDSSRFFNTLPIIYLAKVEVCPEYRSASSLVIPCASCKRGKRDYGMCRETLELYLKLLEEAKKSPDPYHLAKLVASEGLCPYLFFRNIDKLSNLEVIVCTYPYLTKLYDLLMDDVEKIPSKGIVCILDEAHNIEGTIFTTLASINYKILNGALVELGKYVSKHSEELYNNCLRIIEALFTIVNLCRKEKLEDEKIIPIDVLNNLLPLSDIDYYITTLEEACKIIIESYRRLIYARKMVDKEPCLIYVLEFFQALRYGKDIVLVWTNDGIDVRSLLIDCEYTFQDFNHVLMMSGTLPPEDYCQKVWHIPKRSMTYINMSRTVVGKVEKYLDLSVTTRYTERSPEMIHRYVEKLYKIFNMSRKVVLAVAPSYDMVQAFRLVIDNKYPDLASKLIVETEKTDIHSVEKRAKALQHCMILAVAGGKLCEGVEITENGQSLIDAVAICGIPYNPPTEYNQVFENYIIQKCKLDQMYVKNVRAWMLIRQALGRATRSERDYCRWFLLDYRFREKFWIDNLLGNDFKIINL